MAMKAENLLAQVRKMAGMDGQLEKESGGIAYYRERYGYVLSGQGELYTRELAEKWGNAKRAGKSYRYFTKDCARWIGRRVVDCSGLLVEAFRASNPGYGDRTANTFRAQFTKKGAAKDMPELPGIALWKSGHIGIYLGGGKVVEARGYSYGVVVSPLSSQKWKEWGCLRDVDYEDAGAQKPAAVRLLKLTSPMLRGADVLALQKALDARQYAVGELDGIFGKRTGEAVRAFQKDNGLTADGIAGPKTMAALGAQAFTVTRLLKKTSPLMTGEDVKNLQSALISKGYSCGSTGADGEYGSNTEKAVKAFQKAAGLAADGKAGKNTVTALGGVWRG